MYCRVLWKIHTKLMRHTLFFLHFFKGTLELVTKLMSFFITLQVAKEEDVRDHFQVVLFYFFNPVFYIGITFQ